MKVQNVQTVQPKLKPFQSFKPLPRIKSGAGSLFLPRVAGEDEGGGLNGAQRLNGLNDLNDFRLSRR
jgi:hypothetical protein